VQTLNPYRVEQVTMFSDSEVVLFWLPTCLSKFKTFVANRISAIHELASTAVWRHVPTNFNPADLPSRGTTVKYLYTTLLSMDSTHWPVNQHLADTRLESQLVMKPPVITHTVAVVSIHPLQRVVENSSSYVKVVRVATFIFRFAYGRSWKLWNDHVQLPSLVFRSLRGCSA